MNPLPQGVWPVMLTPFRPDSSIDFDALDALIDWYLSAGVAGLFACCLSSEVYQLEAAEKLRLGLRTLEYVAGRVPVVVGVMGYDSQAGKHAAARRFADAGAAAVVLNVAELAAEHEPDDQVQAAFDAFLRGTPGIPVGLYECPRPYHRLLSPELLARLAASGRVRFLKDTCCDLDSLRRKSRAVARTGVRLYSAHTPTLLEMLRAGGDGFCGLGSNFMPDLYVWLCRHFADIPEVAERVQFFLAQSDPVIHRRYPKSAKWWLNEHGIAMDTRSRMAYAAITDADAEEIRSMARSASDLRAYVAEEATGAATGAAATGARRTERAGG